MLDFFNSYLQNIEDNAEYYANLIETTKTQTQYTDVWIEDTLLRVTAGTETIFGRRDDMIEVCHHYTDKNGNITEQCVGGRNCYQMVGISYWNAEAGAKLANDMDEVYRSPGGKERYWDQVALHYKKENYQVAIRECKMEDIVEIDSFNELKQIDSLYADK